MKERREAEEKGEWKRLNRKSRKYKGTECAAQMNALVPVQGLAAFCYQSLEFPI
jgi:hypothetical protein